MNLAPDMTAAFSIHGDDLLGKNQLGDARNENQDLAQFAAADVFWPPPVEDPWHAASASYAWEVKLTNGVSGASIPLELVAQQLGSSSSAVYRR